MIRAAGGIVYRSSKGFLLLKKKNFWEFPKGRADSRDDDVLATALREVKEETGLSDIVLHRGFIEEESYPAQKQEKIVTYYIFTTRSEPKISKEHLGYAWCTFDEAMNLLSYESKRIVLRHAAAFMKQKGILKT